jgi:MFS family permease
MTDSRLSVLEARVSALEAAARPRVLACGLPYDGLISFLTRFLRMFNYGAIAPVFFLYMLELGFSEVETGALLTAILVGDLVITLYLSTRADAFGRRRTLVIGAALKVVAGAAFAASTSFPVLVAAGVVGVISTSGGEIGPFMAIEQAALTDSVLARGGAGGDDAGAVAVLFGYYNLVGYAAQAAGALSSGVAVSYLLSDARGWSALDAYRAVFVAYGCVGGLMALLYATLTPHAEARPKKPAAAAPAGAPAPAPCCPAALAPWLPAVQLGLRRRESKHIVARLALMFAMDAFAGAFVTQTWIAFWFAKRWAYDSAQLGYLVMGANVVAGGSGIAAAYFVRRFGAMLTMIASHLPSNILLLAVPLMPSGAAAAGMLVARFSISQMDVPARQAYVAMVVASDERSAAGGITNIVRSLGMSLAPLLLGYLSAAPVGSAAFNAPWLIAGAVKIVYDIVLYTLYRCDGTMSSGEAVAAKERADDAKDARAAEAAAAGEAAQHAGDGDGDADALDAPLLAGAPRASATGGIND